MRHILSVLIENEPGALSRVVGLFSQRNFNIESLSVAPTQDASLSRMTIMTIGNDHVVEQITKQLNKLIDIVKVIDLSDGDHVERELMLIKFKASGQSRVDIQRNADIFRGQIVDITPTTFTVQMVGDSAKLDAFIASLGNVSILEVVRSGVSGISRGEKILSV